MRKEEATLATTKTKATTTKPFSLKQQGVDLAQVEISMAQLAQLTGVGIRSLENYVIDGKFKKTGPGKVNLLSAVNAVCEFHKAARKTKSDNPAAQELTSLKIAEMKLRIREKERDLIPFTDAAQALNQFNFVCLQEYLMLPARIAPRDMAERDRVEAIINEGRDRVKRRLQALKDGQCSQSARLRADTFAEMFTLNNDDNSEIE